MMADLFPDTYAPGHSVYVSADFLKDDVLTDPTTVTLTFQRPDGTTTTWTYGTPPPLDPGIQRTGPGQYFANIVVQDEGQWVYQWTGTGTAPGASQGYFTVNSRIAEVLSILIRPADYDSVRAMLGVERIDVDDDVIELPAYGPYIEARVKALVPDWQTVLADPTLSVFLRAAVRYGVAAELAESYVKGGTVSLVHREEPRRNWSEWARIFWNRYEEALARVDTTGTPDDDFDLPTGTLSGPTRSRGTVADWTGVYPPVWPEVP
jgi:hypothetical protein